MKLVHDVWWTFFCQEPKLFFKYNNVCQIWKNWDMNTNLSQQEKHWIWKHVCWLGNISCIKKWEDLDVSNLNINIWYYFNNISKLNYGLAKACQLGNRELADLMIGKGADDWNWGLEGACRGGKHELAYYMIEKGATNGYLIDEYFPLKHIKTI